MLYRVSGKEYHEEDSAGFFLRVEAENVDGAIRKALQELSFYGEMEVGDQANMDRLFTDAIAAFNAGSGAEVWVDMDRLFDIRAVETVDVNYVEDTCPQCNGTGRVPEYIPF